MSKPLIDDFDTKKYKYKPVDLMVPSRLIYPDGSFEEFYGRISLGGCKAVTVKDLGPGDRVKMAFLKEDKSFFEVEGKITRIRKVKVSFDDETFKVDSRYYDCSACGWKGYCRLGEDSKVYWETDHYENENYPFNYLQYITRHKENNSLGYDHFCPNCKSELPTKDQELTRLGIKFDDLSIEQEEEISKIIKFNLKQKGLSSKKEMEPGYLLTEVPHFYKDRVHLHNDLLKDFSKCNLKVDHIKELDIHERIKVKIGLENEGVLAVFDLTHQVFETEEKEEFHKFLAIFFSKLDGLDNKGDQNELLGSFLGNFEEEKKASEATPNVKPELVASKIKNIESEENVVEGLDKLQGGKDNQSRKKLLNSLINNFEEDEKKTSNNKEPTQNNYKNNIDNILSESQKSQTQESLEENIVRFYENAHSIDDESSKQDYHESMEQLFEEEKKTK